MDDYEEVPPSALIDPEVSIKYWSSIEATNNGMLGGFPQISRVDLLQSKGTLAAIIRQWEAEGGKADEATGRVLRGADGGAG